MSQPYLYNLGLAFYECVREHGSRTALKYPSGQEIVYEDLNTRSNKIARALLDLHVRPGDVVCIFNRKSVDAFATMIACFKIGAIYTNLDVTSPPPRVQKMLATCRPKLVLFDSDDGSGFEMMPELSTPKRLDLAGSEFDAIVHDASDSDLEISAAVTGADPAYIMFTSGSTGFPKGATMTHANILNLIAWGRTTFGVNPEDVFTNVNPMYFDNSVFDFYVSLFAGATLCPIAVELTQQPWELVRCINRLGCTIWFSVPSLLVYLLTTKALGKEDLPDMRTIIFGGEGFPKLRLRELYQLFHERSRLVNVYGPTECTCICSSYIIQPRDFDDRRKLAPLGHIGANFGYCIDPLDSQDPNFGELLLFGPNVGLGYFNDEELTRRAFLQDTRNTGCRRIMYRTGDLVQKGADGYLHFQGRVDNQVKHMGYRIELEEIEAAIGSLEYVNEVGVIYKREQSGLGQILAFVSARSGVGEPQIRGDLKGIVPPYMLPRRIHLLPHLPKSRNGKVDRKQLQELL